MSASYDEEQPSDLDRARGLLGDTAVEPETSALHSDEHIEAVLTREGYALGVAFLADELVTRFGREPIKIADDGSSLDFSGRIPAWTALATRMRALAAAATAAAAAPVHAPSSGAVCTQVSW